LTDTNWKVLQQAIQAVQKLGLRKAVPQVFAILSGTPAQQVFSKHAQEIQDALPTKKKDTLKKALETQQSSAELRTILKLAGVGAAPATTPPNGDTRSDLEKALPKKDWKIVQEAIAEMDSTARLIEVMKDEKALLPVRIAATHALRAQRAEEAVEPLVDLLNHAAFQIKIAVSSTLVEMGDKRGQKTLKENIQSKDVNVRRESAKTIATMDPPLIASIKGLKRDQRNGLDMLFEDLYKEGRFVFTFTVQALEELGSDNQEAVRTATRERLAKELEARHPLVRAAAVETLCRLGDTTHLNRILEFANPQQEANEWVRLKAVEGLAHVGGPEAVQALRQALKDPDPEIRDSAAKGLVKLGEV
jgi:HEAT repeat protein